MTSVAGSVSFESALGRIGIGAFQRRLLGIFGLVWAADAMQVLAIGFTAPSIGTSFDRPLAEALQTGTAFFLGMQIGAAVFGRLADRFGRRRVLLVTVSIDALFGLLSVVAPGFSWLIALRFLTGLGVGGTLPVDYAMMAEFLPASRRGRWLVILEGFWAIGTVLVALAALVASWLEIEAAWRFIFALTAIPAVVGLLFRLRIPESPLYLLRSGREAEARAVLARVAAANGASTTDLPPLSAEAGGRMPLSALLGPDLARRTVIILVVWLLVSASYYGVFVWLPGQLSGQGFGFVRGQAFLVLVALAQIPGYALAAYGVERWGRRATLIGFLIASAAGCFLFTIAPTNALVTISTLLMSFALLGTWGALYAMTPELYPTALRATGMGAAGATARLGGLLAPSVLAPIVTASFNLALGLFAALLVVAAIAVLGLGVETRNAPLS